MSIEQAFKHLLDHWKEQEKDFKDKYRPYKSKFLKSQRDNKSEKISHWKKVEMLEAAGYIEIKLKKKISK